MNQFLINISKAAAALLLFAGGTAAVSLPDCQVTAPPQTLLTGVRTANLTLPQSPFGITYATLQENIAFVSLFGTTFGTGTLGVLNTTTFPPSLLHQLPLPASFEGPEGLALSHCGKRLFAAAGTGVVVFDTALAVAGSPFSIVGTLNGTTPTQNAGNGTAQVTLSPTDDIASVSQEFGPRVSASPGNIDVFSLSYTDNPSSVSGTPLGFLSLGIAVVGSVLSPSGDILYATSEVDGWNSTRGTISVINATTLSTNPAQAGQAVMSIVDAGCQPVRTVLSSSGEVLWVTVRESNHLLAFNTSRLLTEPMFALLASVQVGAAPVGLTFAKNETRILTADSNRFNYPNASSGLSVVDVQKALETGGKGAVLGRIPTGLFPREFAVSNDGQTVLVSDYTSNSVQAVDVASIP